MDSRDIRYQVFVSSTFRDLTEERREVMQSLLEMDCIPAGMELFPAADDAAWKLITRVIDQSDFYVLIIGGRYGSLDASGVGFTEKEYDYAISEHKHVLPFLHENPDLIPTGKSEPLPDTRERLANFRDKVQKAHHCKFWLGAEDLGGKVSRALIQAIKATSPIGWVRGDQARTVEEVTQVAELRSKLARLESEKKTIQQQYDEVSKKSTHAPNSSSIFKSLQAFFRKVDVEWSVERKTSIADPRTIQELLQRARAALMEYAAQLNEPQDSTLYHALIDAARDFTQLLRDNPFTSLTGTRPDQWAQKTEQAMNQLKFLIQRFQNQYR